MRHRTGSLSICCALALFGCAAPSIEPRVEFTSAADEPFSEMAVKRGVKATYADCQKVRNGVWVVVGKESECLRYWYGGFDNDKAAQALFYFTEDVLVNEPPQPNGVEVDPSKFAVPGYYTRTTPSAMQRARGRGSSFQRCSVRHSGPPGLIRVVRRPSPATQGAGIAAHFRRDGPNQKTARHRENRDSGPKWRRACRRIPSHAEVRYCLRRRSIRTCFAQAALDDERSEQGHDRVHGLIRAY